MACSTRLADLGPALTNRRRGGRACRLGEQGSFPGLAGHLVVRYVVENMRLSALIGRCDCRVVIMTYLSKTLFTVTF